MKKVFVFLLVVIIGIFVYYKFIYTKKEDVLDNLLKNTQEETFDIDKYVIFGTHFNISGCISKELSNNAELILKNDSEEISLESSFDIGEESCFSTSNKNNDGINLDELNSGDYIFLVKDQIEDEEKYYRLTNKNNYNDLEYYTITKDDTNNKINISFKEYNEIEYLEVKIKNEKLPTEIYDITIDPGHGGKDTGASYKADNKIYTESELTLKISLLLKKQLEDLGLKVKLTREDDIMLSNYGDEGRCVIPNEVSSKYSLSIHLNSASGNMKYGGVEVYTPNDINYVLAKLLADNISKINGYSKKPTDKIYDGVYYTPFTSSQVEDAKKSSIDKGETPYDIKVGSPYMFMIREVGGISTYAYVDGRNESHRYNKYYNSNKTAEPYLLELGYINYQNDLEYLYNKSDLFAKAIADALKEYLNIS